jgi:hypothetical protein
MEQEIDQGRIHCTLPWFVSVSGANEYIFEARIDDRRTPRPAEEQGKEYGAIKHARFKNSSASSYFF